MCGNNNCSWIWIIILLLVFCGGWGNCGNCGNYNNDGCNTGCGC